MTLRMAPPRVEVEKRADGTLLLRSPVALRPYARCVGEWLERWAREAPERTFLAERAGDVHISLHSADPALAGRLSDGVHDLVGTLATAGYDAQAWTAGEDRQNQRQQQYEAPRNRRGNDAEPGAEDFGALIELPALTKA